MEKCGGLPLAVVVLGGLLSTKRKTTEEWRHVLQNITWHLIDQDRKNSYHNKEKNPQKWAASCIASITTQQISEACNPW
ncbi:unnamed protein product [Prunus armeniaca]